MILALVNDNIKEELNKLQNKKIIYCENEHMVRVNLMNHRKVNRILISANLISPSNMRVLNTQVKQIGPEVKEIEVVVDDDSVDVVKELVRSSIQTIIYKENLYERLK